MIKIDKKYSTLLFVTIMVLCMTFVISLALTIIRSGFSAGFTLLWLRAWGLAFIVAWPTAMLVVPFARKVVASITR
jgi:hypothetical protein